MAAKERISEVASVINPRDHSHDRIKVRDAMTAAQRSISGGGGVSVNTLETLLDEINRLRSQMLTCGTCKARVT